jgi:crotonobetainyl-CoA:carnitine CoA-transferase CaiB-like acyl-CoA transferase
VADVLGVPDLKADDRFRERDTRKKNRKALTPLLEARLATQDTMSWVEELNKHDVPAGAILTLQQAMEQAQVAHRTTFGSVAVEGIGTIPLFNMTAKFARTPGKVETPPPRLGQHTEEILRGIGYAAGDIEKLKAAKVV